MTRVPEPAPVEAAAAVEAAPGKSLSPRSPIHPGRSVFPAEAAAELPEAEAAEVPLSNRQACRERSARTCDPA